MCGCVWVCVGVCAAINYFNCLQIVEILKETEKSSKNIFGMYSSQRMKDWNTIVSAYQKGQVYLPDVASILQRNVAYEIPAIKKQIAKCQQQQTECEEKCASLNKTVNEINQHIKHFCLDLGIEVRCFTCLRCVSPLLFCRT